MGSRGCERRDTGFEVMWLSLGLPAANQGVRRGYPKETFRPHDFLALLGGPDENRCARDPHGESCLIQSVRLRLAAAVVRASSMPPFSVSLSASAASAACGRWVDGRRVSEHGGEGTSLGQRREQEREDGHARATRGQDGARAASPRRRRSTRLFERSTRGSTASLEA